MVAGFILAILIPAYYMHDMEPSVRKYIIGINVGVTFKEPGSIERQEGKAQRVVDKRKEG